MSIRTPRKELNEMELRLLAISKTKHGTIYYSIIDEFGCVLAIARAKDGWCFNITFVESSPTACKEIIAFIKQQEKVGLLK